MIKSDYIQFIIIILLVGCTDAFGQKVKFLNDVEGYYEGAVINDNSIALMTLELKREGDSLIAISNVKEWTFYSDYKSVVKEDSSRLKFKTYYGTVVAYLDTAYSEFIGKTYLPKDTFDIHFKKVRKPFSVSIEERNLNVDVGDLNLNTSVFIPRNAENPLTCAIFVHGRGCGTKEGLKGRAETLAKYGIAAAVFDKRGSDPTKFDCDENNIDLNTSDLIKVIEAIAELPEIDKTKIGLIGYSFGGWLAPRAAGRSKIKIAFITTIVGPSTSIRQQQLDCVKYYILEEIGERQDIIEKVTEYTLLEYDISNDEITFKKMMAMLENSEEEGWKEVLVEDDIPKSAAEMDKLWVRRNHYDPKEDLKSFEGPFLSILGEIDYVVPLKENRDRFIEIFESVKKENYRIRIIPEAPHWFEHGDIRREIKTNSGEKISYLKFDRVVPGAMNEIIEFLKDYNFIN